MHNLLYRFCLYRKYCGYNNTHSIPYIQLHNAIYTFDSNAKPRDELIVVVVGLPACDLWDDEHSMHMCLTVSLCVCAAHRTLNERRENVENTTPAQWIEEKRENSYEFNLIIDAAVVGHLLLLYTIGDRSCCCRRCCCCRKRWSRRRGYHRL